MSEHDEAMARAHKSRDEALARCEGEEAAFAAALLAIEDARKITPGDPAAQVEQLRGFLLHQHMLHVQRLEVLKRP